MDDNIPKVQGWVKLPKAILFDSKLTHRSVCVYAAIVRYTHGKGRCWPSQKTLAKDMGVTVRTIKRSTAELLKRGHIGVTRDQGLNRRANSYVVMGTPVSPQRGQECPHRGDSRVPTPRSLVSPSKRRRPIEEDTMKEKAPSLGGILDDVFGNIPTFEAPFRIRWRPPDDLKARQDEVVRVMEAWHRHIGPVRILTSMAGANISYRLQDWTAEELVQAVIGYAKATAKWRSNGRKATTPTKFFASDDLIQNYIADGVPEVPFDKLPKLMRLLITREFSNVHFHSEALTKINAEVESGDRKGSDVMNAVNESNRSVDQFLEKLERTTV